MIVLIYDCEYADNLSYRGHPWLMKIASFHKQKGDTVTLTKELVNLVGVDKCYIAKETTYSRMPSFSYVAAAITTTVGRQFEKSLNLFIPTKEIAMARPDYNLYDFEFPDENSYPNYHLFTFNNKFLKGQNALQEKRQKPQNLIMDKDLQLLSTSDLKLVLAEWTKLSKIKLIDPINCEIFENKEILALFEETPMRNTNFTFQKVSEKELMIKNLKIAKEFNFFTRFSQELFFIIDNPDVMLTKKEKVENALEIIHAAALIQSPFRFIKHNLYQQDYTFELLISWSNKPQQSLMEYLTGGDFSKLNDSSRWTTEGMRLAVTLLARSTEVALKCAFTSWEGTPDLSKIDIKYIKEKFNEVYVF